MESIYPITRTKIIIPRRHDEILTRQRLLEILNELLDQKLIIVAAPAGYGKTSLLIDFANHSVWPICWLSLDSLDQDPFRFISHFISAIHAHFPDFGQNSISILNHTPQDKLEIPALVTTLINDIYDHIKEHFILILDDYHLVEENERVREFVNQFIQDVDENCHLMISSRRLLTLPDMPLLVARNQVGGISYKEVSFLPDELQALLLKNYHLSISDQSAESITQQTEGWITGLLLSTQLLEEEIGERIRVARVSGVGLYEYLAQQVFEVQPGDVQEFLLRTSLLEEFDLEKCERVIGGALNVSCPWQELMNALMVRNLFVLPVDEGPGLWLRYHHLFRDFLQARMLQNRPDEAYKITIALGDDFAFQKDWDRSFRLYEQVNATEKMVRMLEIAGSEMIAKGQLLTLQGWLNKLPPEVLNSRSSLISLQAAIMIGMGEVREGSDLLDRVINLLDKGELDKETLTLSLIRRSYAHRVLGDYESSKKDSQRAIDILQDAPELSMIKAEAMRILGGTYYLQGELKIALVTLKESLRIFEAYNDQQNIPKLLFNIGFMNFTMGDYDRAELMYHDALEYWQSGGNLAWAAELLNNLGVLQQLRGDYEPAAKSFEKAVDYAKISNSAQSEGLSLASLGDLYRDLDAFSEAMDVYKQAQAIAKQLNDQFLVFYLDLAESVVSRMSGNLEKASVLMKDLEARSTGVDSAYKTGLLNLEWAMYHLKKKELQLAWDYARRAFDYFHTEGHRNETLKAAFCCGVALNGLGQDDQAMAYLEKVMGTMVVNEYATPIVIQGRELREVISGWVGSQETTKSIEKLLHHVENYEERLPEMRRNIRRQATIVPFAPPRMSIQSFGKAQVFLNNKLVTSNDWQTQISRDMFYLILAHPDGLTREQIGVIFWPDASADELKLRFKNALYRLRRAVGREAVILEDDYYQFNRALDYEYDVETFKKSIQQAENADDEREKASYYAKAVETYKGQYLSDIDETWAFLEEQRYSRLYLNSLLNLANYFMNRKLYHKALDYCHKAISEDPCLEDAHRLAMRIYAAIGNRAAIARQYDHCCSILSDEIGAPPSKQTRDLYEALIQN
ncbi:MAG: tetratricopeptide repeat protein [Brevefilum sp.]